MSEHPTLRALSGLPEGPTVPARCTTSTARAAATAARPLPGPSGKQVSAVTMQAASLAAMADLFAVVVPDAAAIPD